MSNPAPKPDDDVEPWSDADAFRAEFQRRLAEKGVIVDFRRRKTGWEPPVTFPVSSDEASATVIRMRRGEE
jgi:hypothetical protein